MLCFATPKGLVGGPPGDGLEQTHWFPSARGLRWHPSKSLALRSCMRSHDVFWVGQGPCSRSNLAHIKMLLPDHGDHGLPKHLKPCLGQRGVITTQRPLFTPTLQSPPPLTDCQLFTASWNIETDSAHYGLVLVRGISAPCVYPLPTNRPLPWRCMRCLLRPSRAVETSSQRRSSTDIATNAMVPPLHASIAWCTSLERRISLIRYV